MSTRYVSVEEAQKALIDRPPYATVGDYSEILTGRVKRNHSEEARVIDLLDLPPEKLHVTTTLPYFIIVYLHSRKNEEVEESEIIDAAYNAGYNYFPFRRVRKYFDETQAHIPYWYDSKEKKTYYRWTEPSHISNQTQAALDRGEDW